MEYLPPLGAPAESRCDITEIAGKNVVITGGASGLGRLMALEAARLGGNPVLYDTDRLALEETIGEVRRETGRETLGRICDVSKRGEVYAVAQEVRELVGTVDILINNAGLVSGGRLLETPDEMIEAVMNVNVLALYWVTKSLLPSMLERNRGHIVTIASAAGLVGVSRQTDYSASKHAAIGFAESLRVELKKGGHRGVRTTIVEPYYVDTGMFAGVRTRFPRLLPILKQEEVARRVLRAVRRDREEVRMPFAINLLPPLRVLPAGLFDRVMDFFGVNDSMEHFVGRGSGARREGRQPPA